MLCFPLGFLAEVDGEEREKLSTTGFLEREQRHAYSIYIYTCTCQCVLHILF